MALQGNLDTFRLDEILQLIASQRKTGALRLASGERRSALVFEEGRIVSTHEPLSREPSTLESNLARMGRLTEPQLHRVSELRAADGADPQDIMLKANFILADDLAGFLEEHVQDVLLRALSWRSGSYEFITRSLPPPATGFRLSFRTEGVLMEAMRRQDEMSRWRRVLSSPALSLSRHDLSLAREPDPRRRRVLEILATPHTLGDLEETLPLWLFELYEAIFGLWESGSVEVQGAQQRKAAERMRRQLERRPVEQIAFGAGAVVAMVALAVATRFLMAGLSGPPRTGASGTSVWEEVQMAQYCDDARLAAERYRLAHGSYPERLEQVPGWKSRPEGAPDASRPEELAEILGR